MGHPMCRMRALPLMVAALMLAAGFLVGGLAEPAAAAVCRHRTHVLHSDLEIADLGFFTTWGEDAVCGNDAGAPIYYGPHRTLQVGVMDTTSSWFVCWAHGARHEGGNDIWYYTQGDRVVNGQTSHHAWGFMPAVNVHTTRDPGDSTLGPCP